jgi:uncharacterized protein (TIGR03067 family)
MAHLLGLETKEAPAKISSLGGAPQKWKIARIDNFSVGNGPRISTEVGVLDFSALKQQAKLEGHMAPDGVLGADWLLRCSCIIDFAHDVLYYQDLDRKNANPPNRQGDRKGKDGPQTNVTVQNEGEIEGAIKSSPALTWLIRDGYEFVKLERDQNTSVLLVESKANGKRLGLVIDTGSSHTLLSEDVAKDLKLRLRDGQIAMAAVGGSLHKSELRQVDEFMIGSLPPVQMLVLVVDLTAIRAQARQAGNVVPDGVLGALWLSHFSCVVDFGKGVLYYLDPVKKDRSRIDGTWLALSMHRSGVAQPRETTDGVTLRAENDKLRLHDGETEWECTYTLNPGVPTGKIDLVVLSATRPQASRRLFGIYRFDAGDKLTVCLSLDGNEARRPSLMESTERDKSVLIEFVRKKDARPLPAHKRSKGPNRRFGVNAAFPYTNGVGQRTTPKCVQECCHRSASTTQTPPVKRARNSRNRDTVTLTRAA